MPWAFEGLRPLLQDRDPALESHIAAKFATVQALLNAQREGDGFKTYDKLSKAEVKELSDAVNALSEPTVQAGSRGRLRVRNLTK